MKITYQINYFKLNLTRRNFELQEIIPDIELTNDESYYLLQTLRKHFSTHLLFDQNYKMHILSASASDFIENLKELDFQNLGIDEFTTGEPVKLNLDNPSDLNSIRSLFGQILATQLRLKNYLIQQKGSFAFHATLPQRVESFGLLESWPGFEYQFDLIKDDLYLKGYSSHF